MFQTEINHFFQSFASDGLTIAMRFFSALGYPEFFLVLFMVLLFVVSIRKTYLLLILFLWTAAFTFIAKDYFDLPRPFHVDNTLALLDGQLPNDITFDFSKNGAANFWEPIPFEVLEITRKTDAFERGFPSGHSSIAIVLWGAMIFLFQKRWLTVIGIIMMIAIPLSRIYLGVHFLADVLGGIALGGVLLGIFYLFMSKRNRLTDFLQRDNIPFRWSIHSILLLFSPLPLLFFLPGRVSILVALLSGFSLGFLLLANRGLPSEEGTWLRRIGRLLAALGFTSLVAFLGYQLLQFFGMVENTFALFIFGVLVTLSLIWWSVEVGVRMGLYKRSI